MSPSPPPPSSQLSSASPSSGDSLVAGTPPPSSRRRSLPPRAHGPQPLFMLGPLPGMPFCWPHSWSPPPGPSIMVAPQLLLATLCWHCHITLTLPWGSFFSLSILMMRSLPKVPHPFRHPWGPGRLAQTQACGLTPTSPPGGGSPAPHPGELLSAPSLCPALPSPGPCTLMESWGEEWEPLVVQGRHSGRPASTEGSLL